MKMRIFRPRLFLYLLVVAALVVSMALPGVRAAIRSFLRFYGDWMPWGPIILIGLYVTFTLFMLPGVWLTIASGSLYGIVSGYFVNLGAAILSISISFVIGRYLMRSRIEHLRTRKKRFSRVAKAVEERGILIVFLLRLSPVVPFAPSNYLFSLSRLSFIVYLAVSLAGLLPGNLFYVYVGDVTGSLYGGADSAEVAVWRIALLVIGALATVFVTTFVGIRIKHVLADSSRQPKQPS